MSACGGGGAHAVRVGSGDGRARSLMAPHVTRVRSSIEAAESPLGKATYLTIQTLGGVAVGGLARGTGAEGVRGEGVGAGLARRGASGRL